MASDNVQHVQIRTSLPLICTTMQDSGCNPLTKHQVAQLFMKITSQFEKDHSGNFCGASVIIAQSRTSKSITIDHNLKLTAELQGKYPHFFVGFDLVGQEDLGRPLVDFAQKLIELLKVHPNLQFFFHAGV